MSSSIVAETTIVSFCWKLGKVNLSAVNLRDSFCSNSRVNNQWFQQQNAFYNKTNFLLHVFEFLVGINSNLRAIESCLCLLLLQRKYHWKNILCIYLRIWDTFGYIRMLGHLQMSGPLCNFDRLMTHNDTISSWHVTNRGNPRMHESDWNPSNPPNNQSICPNLRNMTSLHALLNTDWKSWVGMFQFAWQANEIHWL